MFADVTRPAPGVAIIRLNRPERLNALSVEMTEHLHAALDNVEADAALGAVVLTGAGRGFCAGGDIKEMKSNRLKPLSQRRSDLSRMHEIPARLRSMAPVCLAAVNGAAFGAGFALALNCDLVLAGQSARFGTAFLKQGLSSDWGLSYQLTRLAGPAKARLIIFLDQVLSAEAAERLGLVSEVTTDEGLQARALELAIQIATHPADARTALRRMLQLAETASHQETLDSEAQAQFALLTSPAHAAAVDGFLGHPA